MNAKSLIAKSLLTGALPLTFFCAAIAAPAAAEAQDRAARAPAAAQPVITLQQKAGEVQTFALNPQALRSARRGSQVRLDLSPTSAIEMTTIRKARLSSGRELIEGHIEGGGLPDGSATLVVNGTSVTGTIETPGGKTYRLRPLGNGRQIAPPLQEVGVGVLECLRRLSQVQDDGVLGGSELLLGHPSVLDGSLAERLHTLLLLGECLVHLLAAVTDVVQGALEDLAVLGELHLLAGQV